MGEYSSGSHAIVSRGTAGYLGIAVAPDPSYSVEYTKAGKDDSRFKDGTHTDRLTVGITHLPQDPRHCRQHEGNNPNDMSLVDCKMRFVPSADLVRLVSCHNPAGILVFSFIRGSFAVPQPPSYVAGDLWRTTISDFPGLLQATSYMLTCACTF
jgi:hypothetical protein